MAKYVCFLLVILIILTLGCTQKEIFGKPNITISKYKGIWCPNAYETEIAYKKMDSLKRDGINIVAIGLTIKKNNTEYYVSENETRTKELINSFHKNNIATAIILNPANPDFDTDFYPEKSIEQVLDMLANLSMKWAEISEKYGVEIFCPANEPNLIAHDEKISEWAQKILPELRKTFSGKIAFQVQAGGNYAPEYNVSGYDYLIWAGITCNKEIDKNCTECIEHQINENYELYRENYKDIKIIYLGGAFTGEDYYYWEPIAQENMKNSEFEPDFFTVSFEGQAKCYDLIFNKTWGSVSGYFLPSYKGWYFWDKPAEDVVKRWFAKK